jgi:hypothetical protein
VVRAVGYFECFSGHGIPVSRSDAKEVAEKLETNVDSDHWAEATAFFSQELTRL